MDAISRHSSKRFLLISSSEIFGHTSLMSVETSDIGSLLAQAFCSSSLIKRRIHSPSSSTIRSSDSTDSWRLIFSNPTSSTSLPLILIGLSFGRGEFSYENRDGASSVDSESYL
jgi:hypothetical protein